MRGLLVTGTDTGVGKTILSAALLSAMAAAGEPVRAHKPVLTGLGDGSPIDREGDSQITLGGVWPADHELLAAAAGMTPEEVAPLRYAPAVSPHLAAELAGERIEPGRLLEAAKAAEPGEGRTLIVEGVGGLLTPLAEGFTVRDFAVALELPVLIAARAGLGTISHTLLTLEAARAAGLAVRAVVLTPWPACPSDVERSNRQTIARMGKTEVALLPRVRSADPAALARAGANLPWRSWLAAGLRAPRVRARTAGS